MNEIPAPSVPVLAYGVKDFCKAVGNIGRSTFYRLVEQGEIQTFKMGARTLIYAKDVDDFIARHKSTSTRRAH